jgi:type I restriction enzyme S subunit
MASLNTGILNSVPIVYPPLQVQGQIVEILETWDEYLEKLDKKIRLKKNIKKGLQQQLLSGETRLTKFTDDWTETEIQKICDIKKGFGLSKDKLTPDGRFECILYGELYTKYNEVIGDVISRTSDNEGISSNIGDVLIPASTTTCNLDLAIAASVKHSDIRLGGDINILRAKKNSAYNSDFLAYYLTHARRHELARLAQGITIVHLYGKDFKKLTLNMPPIEEQTAIVEVLEESAKEIALLVEKRRLLAQQKKFFVNNLITGKICISEGLKIPTKEVQYA